MTRHIMTTPADREPGSLYATVSLSPFTLYQLSKREATYVFEIHAAGTATSIAATLASCTEMEHWQNRDRTFK